MDGNQTLAPWTEVEFLSTSPQWSQSREHYQHQNIHDYTFLFVDVPFWGPAAAAWGSPPAGWLCQLVRTQSCCKVESESLFKVKVIFFYLKTTGPIRKYEMLMGNLQRSWRHGISYDEKQVALHINLKIEEYKSNESHCLYTNNTQTNTDLLCVWQVWFSNDRSYNTTSAPAENHSW